MGNADPRALQVAVAAAGALDWVGLPEAQYALAQATAYIAAAPKSNRAGSAYWAAMADVPAHGSLPVPNHLRSATWREKRDFGTGKGYVFPHDYEGADVEQQYLPDLLAQQERVYYQPSDHGYEKNIGDRMEARRARREDDNRLGGPMPREGPAEQDERDEGRQQRHGPARGEEAQPRRAPEARGFGLLVEGEGDHLHDDEQRPQGEEEADQRAGDEQDAAEILRHVDVLRRGAGGKDASGLDLVVRALGAPRVPVQLSLGLFGTILDDVLGDDLGFLELARLRYRASATCELPSDPKARASPGAGGCGPGREVSCSQDRV